MTQRALIISCWLLRVVFSFFFFSFSSPPFSQQSKSLVISFGKGNVEDGARSGLGWTGDRSDVEASEESREVVWPLDL